MEGEGFAETHTLGDLLADVAEDGLEVARARLLDQRGQRLRHRGAGPKEGRQLAREVADLLPATAGLQLGQPEEEGTPLLLVLAGLDGGMSIYQTGTAELELVQDMVEQATFDHIELAGFQELRG